MVFIFMRRGLIPLGVVIHTNLISKYNSWTIQVGPVRPLHQIGLAYFSGSITLLEVITLIQTPNKSDVLYMHFDHINKSYAIMKSNLHLIKSPKPI